MLLRASPPFWRAFLRRDLREPQVGTCGPQMSGGISLPPTSPSAGGSPACPQKPLWGTLGILSWSTTWKSHCDVRLQQGRQLRAPNVPTSPRAMWGPSLLALHPAPPALPDPNVCGKPQALLDGRPILHVATMEACDSWNSWNSACLPEIHIWLSHSLNSLVRRSPWALSSLLMLSLHTCPPSLQLPRR